VPPDVLTGVLLDCVGADDGVRKVPELPVPDDAEPLLAELDPLPDVPEDLVPDDEACADGLVLAGAVDSDRPEVLAAACEAPGSTTAITPAATALTAPAAMVAVRTDLRPRSRSAAARDTARAASRSRRSSDESIRKCGVLMPISVTGRLP
jgi:hypothetical protein